MHNRPKKIANSRHIQRHGLLKTLIVLLTMGALGAIGVAAGVIGAWYYVQPGLPDAETIRDIPLQVPLRIFSRDGRLISEIGERRRIPVAYEQVPAHVVNAFVAAEDQRFFEHPGVDYRGILRALFELLTKGEIGSGGSTLTQQLARSYFLSLEQSFARKFTEASLAVRIENAYSKEEIMTFFLNKMFFGQRAYGVAAASQIFFDKELGEIDVAEAATLAGVLPAPSRYNPVTSADAATVRRNYVLGRMLALNYIDQSTYDNAFAATVESELHGTAIELNAPYVAEMARADMLRRFGDSAYTAGYQVVTSLDSRMQRAANYALRNGLLAFTRRRGYRGPMTSVELPDDLQTLPVAEWPQEITEPLRAYAPGGLSLALVTDVLSDDSAQIVFRDGSAAKLPWSAMNWAKPFIDRQTAGPEPESAADVLAAGDVVYVMPTSDGGWALAQPPVAQGAVVAVDPYDGAITALTGGFDYRLSKFNRATQAYRQPGSSFKPFIYSAALENGSTVATVVDDSPVVIHSSELEKDWRPINYSGRFYGPTRMREALVHSMNLVSVRLLLYETGVGNAVRHIAQFGFGDAALPRNGSLALGGGSASPLDMAQGYATIANGGHAVKPYVIDAIFGPDGDALYRAEPAIVCDECVADDPTPAVPLAADSEERTRELEQMADVVLDYRPDANAAPGLFEDMKLAPRVITPQNAFLVQDMMRDVVRRGTGRRALTLGRGDLSGKTGTSNDRRDAWFGGFNADIAAIVWVGYNDDSPLGAGEEGSRTALPIWVDFAGIALEGTPDHQMPMPDGIVSVRIDRETGCPARAGQLNAAFEVFRDGHVPDCEQLQDISDPFNNAASVDLPPMETQESDEEPEESIF